MKTARRIVELRSPADVPERIAPALKGCWTELPARLTVHELSVLGHMVNGYTLAEEHLGREAFQVADDLRRGYREHRRWDGSAVELLAGFFAIVRGWLACTKVPTMGTSTTRRRRVSMRPSFAVSMSTLTRSSSSP